MITVNYIGDLDHAPSDTVLLIECDDDYVKVCHELSPRKVPDEDMEVWVRSQNHFAWLKEFVEHIGCPSKFDRKTARHVLSEQWNVRLPDWLNDEDILGQNLLKIEGCFQQEQASFTNCLLTHLLSSEFQSNVLNTANLVKVIKVLVNYEAKMAFKQYPVLSRCLETKCEKWVEDSDDAWAKIISAQIAKNESKTWQWLSIWACLHSYPKKLLEFVLTPEQILCVQKVPVEAVKDLPLEPLAKEQALTQIKLLFNDIREQITSSDEFQKVVEMTSGKLPQEYNYVTEVLKSNLFSPTKKDIQCVQNKFRLCPGISENKLNSLLSCVRPKRPTLLQPEEEWDSAEWLRWTTEEYCPYRNWQVHTNHYDEELEKTIALFSEWFIKEYTSIHKDSSLSLIHCLRPLSSSDLANELSIILMVDCLPLNYASLLDNSLRNVGLSRHNLHYLFAMLPTITKFNKPALFSGEWGNSGGDYETTLKNRAEADWNNKPVVYLNNLKAMSSISVAQEGAVILLNFIEGDELLHSDVESQNTTYEEELSRHFTRMAESVIQLTHNWTGQKENITIYVTTDHGACRILEEEKRSFDSTVVNRIFPDEKYRFAMVEEDKIDDIPDNLWALGHKFKQPFVSEAKTFFLPKGHNTVRLSGRAKGYLHGGATPEEVIVPMATYKLIKATLKKPATRFLNVDLVKGTSRAKFYIQRVVDLEIEIQNPNSADLKILGTSIISPEAELKNCAALTIPAGGAKTLQVSCYFKKSASGKDNLELKIEYEILGEQNTLSLRCESEFKSAMAGGFRLKDL
jgi:hypothetical protein